MASRSFSTTSFLLRWIAALALVLATYNPHYAYLQWVAEPGGEALPFKVLAGIALAILYVIFLRATWRSIGPIGLVLALAFFGAVVWTLVYYDWLALEHTKVMTYVVLVLLASIMAVGLSWSHIRRRLTGQLDTDMVDD